MLPVLAASRTYVDEQVDVAVERLGAAAAERWARPFETHEDVDTLTPLRFLKRQPHGPVVQRATVPAATAYRHLLRQLRAELRRGLRPELGREVRDRGPARRPGALPRRERSARAARAHLGQDRLAGGDAPRVQWQRVTPGDPRRLAARGQPVPRRPGPTARTSPPHLHAVGTFDPDRLGATPEPGATPLSTMQPPLLTARDDATAARLGGRPLLPNGNLAGYIMQPPA